jgi:hypothetical protein
MGNNTVDYDTPVLNLRDYCAAAGLDVVTANNFINRGFISVDEVVSGRGRGFRKFSVSNAWRGRIMVTSAEHGKMPLADAAEIARLADRLARKEQWMQQWSRALQLGHPVVTGFLAVTWSDDCYDAEIIPGGKGGWPDFSDERSRFLSQPFLLLPLSELFEDVWKKSVALLRDIRNTRNNQAKYLR